MSRYKSSALLDGGKKYGTSDVVHRIRLGISSGEIGYSEITMTEGQRLDMIAAREYGSSTYWWVIAAASNIGWGLQVPPMTNLKIPDLKKVMEIV